MAAVPLATVIGAPLSGVLLGLDGVHGLKGWQWLFIIEGVPAVLLGLAALKVLDDGPAKAKWLSAPERKGLSTALAADDRSARKHGYSGLVEAMTRPRIFALALLYFLIVIGLYGIGFWMPQLTQNFGVANLTVGLLTAIPYLVASIVMVLCGWNSDRTGERRWHIALPLLIGEGRELGGSTYHDAQAIYALTVNPRADRTAEVQLTPELHYGSRRFNLPADELDPLVMPVHRAARPETRSCIWVYVD